MYKYNREDFVDALFDSNETTGFGDGMDQCCYPKSTSEFKIDTESEVFSVNPFNDWRKGTNMKITSLLFEVDEKIETKEQIKLFLSSGLPFTTMTYSGGKSIHVIIRFIQIFNIL